MSKFDSVIGLEVHVQLATASKMFCRCPNIFGKEPNSLVCPVCMGLPGILPVLNKKALDLGTRVALALNCAIQEKIIFERKHYFYPDLPKNFQISQYARPLGEEGKLDIKGETIRIKRVHLEEDAGKLIHTRDYSLVDLNRAGVPLLEIVSYPDISSASQAYDYLKELKLIVQYVGASSCDMEKGFLRCDANISLKEEGSPTLGVKVELKNMNSFRQVESALEYEIRRQEKILLSNKKVFQETRLWDEEKKITTVMRTKEEAHDYRYFPEPDLLPITIKEKDVETQKKSIPEMPARRRQRFSQQYYLGEKEIEIILSNMFLAEFFEASHKIYPNTKKVVNWIIGPLLEVLNSKGIETEKIQLTPDNFARLIKLASEGKVTNIVAKDILSQIIDKDADPERIVQEKGLSCVSNQEELTGLVKDAIESNPRAADDFRTGKEQALMFLVGQVMRKTRGKASPNTLKSLFIKILKEKP
ncbi:MAG: Asp-tRNA(Asn)/Glu-tRNA(Gln) amidotransferase subunit GatB [Candidatus Omnitrophica bacterium]|nr:Asp-tRNA(Asn)/Glu-tRNA(Gln) amidotransferase subunit GatB [Candidatus Omnitrophota bacterium]